MQAGGHRHEDQGNPIELGRCGCSKGEAGRLPIWEPELQVFSLGRVSCASESLDMDAPTEQLH